MEYTPAVVVLRRKLLLVVVLLPLRVGWVVLCRVGFGGPDDCIWFISSNIEAMK